MRYYYNQALVGGDLPDEGIAAIPAIKVSCAVTLFFRALEMTIAVTTAVTTAVMVSTVGTVLTDVSSFLICAIIRI